MTELFPAFLNLAGRRVVLVGGGAVAASKLAPLLAAGARVRVVSPAIVGEIAAAAGRGAVDLAQRPFATADLDDAWLVVAAATPAVNREIAHAAAARRLFVNAVDDPANASAFLGGVVRRDGVALAISTAGVAPALTALLREALDAVLPADLGAWVRRAREERAAWRREQVPMRERKPLLLRALNRLYGAPRGTDEVPRRANERKRGSQASGVGSVSVTGHVSLVGAGPGDPGLLTRTAALRLRAADLVLYDALVDDRVLHLCRRARRCFVGKRAHRHALAQPAIEALMIRAARRGWRVVRLKGGDPFVFGRGGEEAIALARAGVPFDVVPGISSAIAAPAAAGIPLTHRGVASAFLVVSGHDEHAFASAVGSRSATAATLVVLMGMGHAAGLARILVNCGWSAATPAAIIFDATLPEQQVWRGTLEALAAGVALTGSGGPGTLVVGEVVGLARAVSGLNSRQAAALSGRAPDEPRRARAATGGGGRPRRP